MGEKKNKERLSIKFDSTIASNVQAMKILDAVGQRKQAQIIAEALVLYNQMYGIVDTSNPLVVSTIPQTVNATAPAAQSIPEPSQKETQKETSFADEYNASLNSDDDFEYDDEYEDEYDDESFDDAFMDSLANMGITPND